MPEKPEIAGRGHRRIRYENGRASLRTVASGPSFEASLLDISLGGCRLAVAEPLFLEAAQMVEVKLDLNSCSLRALGTVRFTGDDGRTVGVAFHRLKEPALSDLEEFIEYFSTFR